MRRLDKIPMSTNRKKKLLINLFRIITCRSHLYNGIAIHKFFYTFFFVIFSIHIDFNNLVYTTLVLCTVLINVIRLYYYYSNELKQR